MKKKLSCGLLALSMAFSSAPALLNGTVSNIGAVDVFADGTTVTITSTALDDLKTSGVDADKDGKITIDVSDVAVGNITTSGSETTYQDSDIVLSYV